MKNSLHKIDFHDKIRKHYSKLTPRQIALSRYILKNIDEIPFLSITSLSHKIPVSESTITRFCFALGYTGYSDFQKDMQRWIQLKLAPSQRLEKTSFKGKDNFLLQFFNLDMQNLKGTLENLAPSDIQKAIQLLVHSQRIFIIGLRSSFGLAYHFHHQLSRIMMNPILLDGAQALLFDRIINIGPKDTLLVITFHPYAKMAIQVAEYFKEQGCRIIAITDGILSPLAQISDFLIQAKANSPSFFLSHTATLCVLNCLIAGVSMANSKRSIEALKKVEAKLPRWDTWALKRD